MQYFPFKLVSAVAESEPRISLCPPPFTLTLHNLQVAHDLCLRSHLSPVPVLPVLRYPAGEPSNGHHLCPQALRHISYHGSVPQPSSFNQHQAVRFLRLSRGGAAWRPTVLCIQFLGSHVYRPGTLQTPLKTTPAVCVGAVRSSREVLVDSRRGRDDCAQIQPWFNLDRALWCAQRRRRSASAWSLIRVRTYCCPLFHGRVCTTRLPVIWFVPSRDLNLELAIAKRDSSRVGLSRSITR